MPSNRFTVKSEEERRGNLRQFVQGTNVRIETAGGETFIAELRDVSRSGVRFYASTQIPCGSRILILPPASSNLPAIRARIMRQKVVDTPNGSLLDCGAQYTEDAELRRHSWWIEMRKAA